MRKLIFPVVAAAVLVTACSDGGGEGTAATMAPATTVPAVDDVDPASVKVYTSAEVCALVAQDVAASTLGVDVSGVSEVDMSTPQCSYNFTTADGVRSNLTLAVQRPVEDLGGAAGMAGFDLTTSLVIFDTPYEPLPGLGDAAAVSASESFTIIAVLANSQVFTIATSAPIDVAQLVAFGSVVAANV